MDPNLLMTVEEYNKTRHKTPYVFSLSNGKQFLFYFGCEHTRDPQNGQFNEIESFWSDFLNKTNKQNCLIFIESVPLPKIMGEREEIIKEYGERGFMAWLAEKEKIPLHYPEILIGEEAEMLAKNFPKKLVVYFYFIRSVQFWIRGNTPGDFEAILEGAANACRQRISWQNVSCSVEDMRKIHEEIFGESLSLKNRKTIDKAPVPIYYDSVINEISRASSCIRNLKILEEIEKSWREGKNLFILYGASNPIPKTPRHLSGHLSGV